MRARQSSLTLYRDKDLRVVTGFPSILGSLGHDRGFLCHDRVSKGGVATKCFLSQPIDQACMRNSWALMTSQGTNTGSNAVREIEPYAHTTRDRRMTACTTARTIGTTGTLSRHKLLYHDRVV